MVGEDLSLRKTCVHQLVLQKRALRDTASQELQAKQGMSRINIKKAAVKLISRQVTEIISQVEIHSTHKPLWALSLLGKTVVRWCPPRPPSSMLGKTGSCSLRNYFREREGPGAWGKIRPTLKMGLQGVGVASKRKL